MIVDEKVPLRQLRQFASQSGFLHPQETNMLKGMFRETQPDDFYCGLMAGLLTAETIYQSGHLTPDTLKKIMVYLAGVMERKEII